jgi:RHS repeat-associated protein
VAFGYDLAGNVTEIIYPDGAKDTTEYDLLGRVARYVPRTGLTTAYEYDALGNVVSVTQGEQVTRYEYDLLGRLVKTIRADGTEEAYAYDALGNLLGVTDPLGSTTSFAYTAESLLEKVTYANGVSQSLSYDLAGNVLCETDAEGYTKQYQYDAVNRLIGVVDELGGVTRYLYDALDHIAQVTDALGHETRYTYDANGHLTAETDALGNTVTYAYTPEGWLEKVVKADGQEITFAYDQTGSLLIQRAGEDYSVSSRYNEIGQVTEVSSAAGTIAYQYDERGNLLSVTNHNGDVVSYTYDQYGNKISMTYPDGRTVSYTYDAMNRMTSVVGLDGETTTYSYDPAGRRVRTASGTLTTEYTYDSVGNLIRQETSGASEIAFSYSHNKNGYITGEKRTENGQTTDSAYAYDALGQLTAFTQSTGYGERYAYDAAGNMLQKVITGTDGKATALSMQYNAGNQLLSMTVGQESIAYAYDANGSMIRKTLTSAQYGTLTDTYTYDALDMLTGYAGYDGYTQQFTYDANGIRQSKREKGNTNRSTLEELLRGSIAGLPDIVELTDTVEEGYEWATTEYLYDITQEYYQVIQETTTQGNGKFTTAYTYGLERIAGYTSDTKTAYVYDGRGSVAQTITAPVAGKAVTSTLPDVSVKVQSFSYTAYGEQMGAVKSSGFTYNGEAFDAATGMLNLRARQFEPTLSRFSQKDIVNGLTTLPLSISRYLYCINCPTIYNDPSGMLFEKVSDALKRIGESIMNVFIPTAKALSVSSSLEQTKHTIENLASAASVGMDNAKASKDPNVKVAYKKAKQQIDSKEKAENRALSIEEKNKIFASACMLTSMKLAEMYGANTAKEFTSAETLGVYSSMIAMNPNTTKSDRAIANQLLMDNGFSKAPFDKKMVCVPYVCNAYQNSALFEVLRDLPRYNKIIRQTTPLYAALAGGESREYGNITGSDLPSEYVKAVISLGNNGEAPKIKLAGDSEYIDLYDSSIISFTTSEQLDILLEAQITQPLDIMFFGKSSYTKDNKTIKSTNKNYNPDINQVHVVLLDSASAYSGMGAESGSGNSNVQKNKKINADNKFGIDMILMNHNLFNIQSAIDLLGGK